MTDVFKVQDEIAAAVVEQLKIKLLGEAPRVSVTDPRAYALFLQGREVARQFSPASLEHAIDLYEQALAVDPAYAPAWDGLASAYFNQMDLGVVPLDDGHLRAKRRSSRHSRATRNMRLRTRVWPWSTGSSNVTSRSARDTSSGVSRSIQRTSRSSTQQS